MKNRVIASFAAVAALAVYAQPQPSKATFVAAAIKLDPQADGSDMDRRPGLVFAQMTLRSYIAFAYEVRPFQVTGGPNWIDQEHYAINAKMEHAVDANGAPLAPTAAQVREAMQNLLADRFQVKFHRESKESQGYALVIAKGGLKVTPDDPDANGGSSMNSRGDLRRTLEARRASMPRIAEFLSRELQLPVADQTDTSGVYTFTLDWSRENLKVGPKSAEERPLPTIFTAIQEKLGLRLEPRKAPLELIVVDDAARPSQN